MENAEVEAPPMQMTHLTSIADTLLYDTNTHTHTKITDTHTFTIT